MKKFIPTKLESFTDKDGDIWIRHSLPGHVIWPKGGWVARYDENNRLKAFRLGEPRKIFTQVSLNSRFCGQAIAAIVALWQVVDSWSFTCTPDKVDLSRILREAYDAGLREVVVDVPNSRQVYAHSEVLSLLFDYEQAHHMSTMQMTVGVSGWVQVDHEPCLALARAWKAAQTVKKITVHVSGTK